MTKKFPDIYAFIDSQNLNLGTKNDIHKGKKVIYQGWQLDFRKFRKYLSDKFRVTKAFLFIGYIEKYEPMYKALKEYGYELVYKPTTIDNHGKPKGNVDAELVLYAAAIEYKNFDQAVIVSGDGDFRCLHEHLVKNKKLKAIIIPNSFSESTLLKDFQEYKIFIQYEKAKLELEDVKKKG